MVKQHSLQTETGGKRPVFSDNPKTVRVALDAGESISEHSHPGTDIVFFVVSGAMTLELDEQAYDLAGGDILQFEGERTISGSADDETAVLVVLAERPA